MTDFFRAEATTDISAAYQLNEMLMVKAGMVDATDAYPDGVVGSDDEGP